MTKVATVQAQQKWEYCSESRRTESTLVVAINDRGQSGWELVGVIQHKDPKGETLWTAFLKRPGVGQAPMPSPQVATTEASTSTVAFVGQAKEIKESTASPQGFDLSGDEFALKTD